MARPIKYLSVTEQLNSNVTRDSITGCWLWKLKLQNNGYAKVKLTFWAKYYRCYTAHQLSYIWYYGDYDRNLMIRHTCNIRHCVNPTHLCLGTAKDNQNDKAIAGSVKGSKNGFSKLDEKQVRDIKLLLQTNSVRNIAKIYNVHYSTIGLISAGKTWTHV